MARKEARRAASVGTANPARIVLLCACLILASIACLVLAGCARLSGIGKTGAAADAIPAVSLQTPAPEISPSGLIMSEDTGPARGGTLRLFMLATDSLDPLRTLDPYVMDYGWFIYDPLVRVDDAGKVTPFLAETLQSSQEGRIWDVTLRSGILFHDGGELSAADVVFSIEHAREVGEDSPYGTSLANISSFEVVSRLKLRLILKQPDSEYSRSLCFPVLTGRSWKADPDGAGGILIPVGTGAFRFGQKDAAGITLTNSGRWWNASREGGLGHPVWPESIRFLFGTDETDRITLFQQRKIDATWTQVADRIRYANRKDLEYREYPGTHMEFAAMGSGGTGVRDPAVKSLLIRYLAGCSSEGGFPGEAVVNAEMMPLSEEEVVSMLETAGCKYGRVGERLVLSVPGNTGWRPAVMTIIYHSMNLERLKTAEWMTTVLERIGVAVLKVEATSDEERKLAGTGKFDLMLLGCESPAQLTDLEMLAGMRSALGTEASVSELMPLYRERRAMLYSIRIRGAKKPAAGSVYDGWSDWYLLETADAAK